MKLKEIFSTQNIADTSSYGLINRVKITQIAVMLLQSNNSLEYNNRR